MGTELKDDFGIPLNPQDPAVQSWVKDRGLMEVGGEPVSWGRPEPLKAEDLSADKEKNDMNETMQEKSVEAATVELRFAYESLRQVEISLKRVRRFDPTPEMVDRETDLRGELESAKLKIERVIGYLRAAVAREEREAERDRFESKVDENVRKRVEAIVAGVEAGDDE